MSRREVGFCLTAALAQGAAFALVGRWLLRRQPAPAPPAPIVAAADSAASLQQIAERLSAVERELAELRVGLSSSPSVRAADAAVPPAGASASAAAPGAAPAVANGLAGEEAWPGAAAAGFQPRERSAESYLDEGNVYFEVGQFERAADRFSRVLQAQPDSGRAHYNRAAALARLGQTEAALADYGRAAALMPNDPDVPNNRGLLYFANGDTNAAVADFRRAAALAPDDSGIAVNLGLALLEGGEPAAALALFARVPAEAADGAFAAYGAALALCGLGRETDAVAPLQRAVDADPELAKTAREEPRLRTLRDHPAMQPLFTPPD